MIVHKYLFIRERMFGRYTHAHPPIGAFGGVWICHLIVVLFISCRRSCGVGASGS